MLFDAPRFNPQSPAAHLDELSTLGDNTIAEFYQEHGFATSILDPQQFPLQPVTLDDLVGGDRDANAEIVRRILRGEDAGPKRDAVLLNAGAALFGGGPRPIHWRRFGSGGGDHRERQGTDEFGRIIRAIECHPSAQTGINLSCDPPSQLDAHYRVVDNFYSIATGYPYLTANGNLMRSAGGNDCDVCMAAFGWWKRFFRQSRDGGFWRRHYRRCVRK